MKLNKDGISLLSTLIIGTAITYTVINFSKKTQMMRKQVNKANQMTKESDSLKGVMVYAKYILAKRKCIDLKNGLINSNCIGISDPGSLERLLLSPSSNQQFRDKYSEDKDEELGRFYDSNSTLRLEELEFQISKGNITSAHPLYTVMSSKQSLDADTVKFKYESTPATDGNQIYVKINLSFLKAGQEITKASSQIIIYPRQINQYAFVSARALSVGQNSDNGVNSLKGIHTFESPVFINEDLLIPKEEGGNIQTRFHDTIYLGKSLRFFNKQLFSPAKAGQEKFLEQLSQYKGLKGGIDNVNHEPSLASLFAYNSDAIPVDNMKLCIDYEQRKFDPNRTNNSRLVVKKITNNSLYLGLTKLNEFKDIPHKYKSTSQISYGAGGTLSNLSISIRFRDRSTGNLTSSRGTFSLGVGRSATINLDKLGAARIQRDSNWALYSQTQTTKTYKRTIYQSGEKGSEKNVRSQQVKVVKAQQIRHNYKTQLDRSDYPQLPSNTINISPISLQTTIIRYEDCQLKTTAPPKPPTSYYRCSKLRYIYNPTEEISTQKTEYSHPKMTFSLQPANGKSQRSLSFSSAISSMYKDSDWKYDPVITVNAHSFRTSYNEAEVPGSGPKSQSREIEFKVQSGDIQLKENYSSFNWELPTGSNRSISITDSEEIRSLSSSARDFFSLCNDTQSVSVNNTTSKHQYNTDYSNSSFTSWNLRPIDKENQFQPSTDKSGFDGLYTDSDSAIDNKIIINSSNHEYFHNYSVLDRCIIKANASQVMGFLVCRKLVIEPRTQPLTMIGTFIIDKTDFRVSDTTHIKWINAFNPKARSLLSLTGRLHPISNCKVDPIVPLWIQAPMNEYLRQLKCSPSSLMESMEPLKWTSFSPLCGLSSSAEIETTCKPSSWSKNFYIINLHETYGL